MELCSVAVCKKYYKRYCSIGHWDAKEGLLGITLSINRDNSCAFERIRRDSTRFLIKIIRKYVTRCNGKNCAENRENLWYNRVVIRREVVFSIQRSGGACTAAQSFCRRENHVFCNGEEPLSVRQQTRRTRCGPEGNSRQKRCKIRTKIQNPRFFTLAKSYEFCRKFDVYFAYGVSAAKKTT